MVVPIRAEAKLRAELDEVLDALRSAGERFDQGRFTEAHEVATQIGQVLRVIGQLGLQSQLTWVDTAGVTNPGSAHSAACLTLMHVRGGPNGRGRYVPKFGLYPPAPIRTRAGGQIERGSRIPFEEWWTNSVIKDCDGAEYSRQQLVLAMANPVATGQEAREARAALAASPSLGWVLAGGAATAERCFESNPVMASVRQIAYEVAQTIVQQRAVVDVPAA